MGLITLLAGVDVSRTKVGPVLEIAVTFDVGNEAVGVIWAEEATDGTDEDVPLDLERVILLYRSVPMDPYSDLYSSEMSGSCFNVFSTGEHPFKIRFLICNAAIFSIFVPPPITLTLSVAASILAEIAFIWGRTKTFITSGPSSCKPAIAP